MDRQPLTASFVWIGSRAAIVRGPRLDTRYPPYLYRQVNRKRFDQGLRAVAAGVLGVPQPAPCP